MHGTDTSLAALAPASGVGPVQQAVDDEEKKRLRAALENLTEPHRLVFELAVYQQLPYADISQVLGIPVGTVKSRMHNCVRALRHTMMEQRNRQDEERKESKAGQASRFPASAGFRTRGNTG